MAETTAFSELLRIPIERKFKQRRTLGDGALLVAGATRKMSVKRPSSLSLRRSSSMPSALQ
jgi:hypothetical protein